jgi:energy-coupling factor transport system permease protein
MAMEARCYRGGKGRTKMNPLKYAKSDLVAFLCLAALVVLIVLTNKSGIGVI